MKLELIGHTEEYAVSQLQMALFPGMTEGRVVSRLHRGEKWLTAVTEICVGDRKTRAVKKMLAEKEDVRMRRRILQQSFYNAALPHLPEVPAWGALSGVRPTKITTKHLLEGGTPESADRLLRDTYYVSEERRKLALDCSLSTVAAVEKMEKQDVSLYVGIPFCPTRCTYCSFVSRTVGKNLSLLDPYLEALLTELSYTGKLLRDSGHTVRTVYIGGGTPTTLSAAQMERLMHGISDNLSLDRCIEFTVEGGRPDTLDEEKLRVIRACGADRISINPQTMEDHVLRACGRPHTARDVEKAYKQAVDAGFTAINMDLIAGMPQDSLEGFCRSLDRVAALDPANITVHTLALKKGADLFEKRANLPAYEEVSQMVAYAGETLSGLSYKPYYLYRQKYMSGSFENVGWSKNGQDCLYNIYMMEELHPILSLGGGGMNKVNLPGGALQRFHNPKFPEQYIGQLQDVLGQKEELFALMKGSV
ncbi:MAG: coproporphyrinogen dehydrogenase HemZ [Oscillospiraceae bacterium]|nr:coproporphyrinogen dehydrogenase HemZ [Oscillospiraceae bacterium]